MLLFLAVFGAAVALKADGSHLDTVILDDGNRIHGIVVEDTSDHLLLRDNGVDRRLSRQRVLKVIYDDAEAPLRESATASPVPAAPVYLQPTGDPALTDYCNGLSEFYGFPVYQVVAVQQRVPMEEVPVVLHLAVQAHVAPNVVLGLRLGGLSWGGVALKLGVGNDAFFVEGGDVLVGSPFEHLYIGFWGLPHRRWARLRLSDADIIECVNLRFVNTYYHRPLVELGRVRRVEPFYHHAWRPQAEHVVPVEHAVPVQRREGWQQPRRGRGHAYGHEDRDHDRDGRRD
jgi:hypothetical protein